VRSAHGGGAKRPFSPHAWGCTVVSGARASNPSLVFPTRVGVYRGALIQVLSEMSFPHTRGGVPGIRTALTDFWVSFPHTRGGVPLVIPVADIEPHVFPTRVGVYRMFSLSIALRSMFSPHAWGCTVHQAIEHQPVHVFPTRVGVYRISLPTPERGRTFSPHAWGCTSSRYPPSRFGGRFPHTRGGVPSDSRYPPNSEFVWGTFSPHAWGCTVPSLLDARSLNVARFPHTRGGVPQGWVTQ
jgi:hypothetical protein